MPVIYLPGATGSRFGPNGGESITQATSGLAETAITGVGEGLFGRPKTEEERQREAELTANQGLYGAQQIAQTGLDAPNAPWRTNPADALDGALFDNYQQAVASGAKPEVLAQIRERSMAIRQQFQESRTRQRLASRMEGAAQLDPDVGAKIQEYGLIESALDPSFDVGRVYEAFRETMGRAEEDRTTMALAQARLSYLDEEMARTFTPEYLANNPNVMNPETGEYEVDPSVRAYRDTLTKKKIDIATEGLGIGVPYNQQTLGARQLQQAGTADPTNYVEQPGATGGGTPSPAPSSGSAAVSVTPKPMLSSGGGLAKAVNAKREAEFKAAKKQRLAERVDWDKASTEVRATFVFQAAQQIKQQVEAGVSPQEASASVLREAAEKSPFFEAAPEVGGMDAPQPEFAEDVKAALELMLEPGSELTFEELRALYEGQALERRKDKLRRVGHGEGR